MKRLADDGSAAVARMDRLDRPTVFRILRDWKIWTWYVILMKFSRAR